MLNNYHIIPADDSTVIRFISCLEKGRLHFRYFEKRPVQVIHNHIVTYILVDKHQTPLAYGHLEKEDNTLWLGIAVADDHTGKGLGKIMMNYLINAARSKQETKITLSVDHNNLIAQKLYADLGFVKIKDLPACLIFELILR